MPGAEYSPDICGHLADFGRCHLIAVDYPARRDHPDLAAEEDIARVYREVGAAGHTMLTGGSRIRNEIQAIRNFDYR